jgi:hypothetical protein
MPAALSSLDEYSAKIRQWHQEGLPVRDIQERLERQHGVIMSTRTFERRLRSMEIRTYTITEDTDALRARIKALFFSGIVMTDALMLDTLKRDGFTLSKRRLGEIRREEGLLKRYTRLLSDAKNQEALEIVQQELALGNSEDLGRYLLYNYMRSRYNIVGR